MSTQSTDKALREEVARDQLQAHNAAIAKWVRLSGSADEAEAFDYIAAQCEAFGLNVQRYAVDALVSLPGAASLSVTTPEVRDFPCLTHSASRPTGPGGITATLVYAGDGLAADYAKLDARGKIALVEGLAGAPKAVDGDAAGVLGIICINPEGLHEMNFSPVWGTPTPETAPKLPHLAAISVRKEIGDELKGLLAAGEVTVHIETEIDAGWRPIPVLTADLPGADEDRFVLLSGHVDSWYHGAMDNASANATMLEIGRILAAHRGDLRRGLRLAFWSGHSHARYAGSTWYADNFFTDLREHCVCHVNAESTGGLGADELTGAGNMAETWQFAAGPIREITGQELRYRRMMRSHDQSFAGLGVPSMLSGLSAQPGGGLGWWWHTPDDTLDKIDPDRLVRDTQIYLATCWGLCTVPVLPFDYTATADELGERLQALATTAGERFDLTPLVTALASFRDAAAQLNAASDASRADAQRAEAINAALLAVAHALIPVNYSEAGPYEVDLALGNPPLPGLQSLATLAKLDAASDESKFLRTKLMRERNRIWDALNTAQQAIDQAL
jgi:hypothetical protein